MMAFAETLAPAHLLVGRAKFRLNDRGGLCKIEHFDGVQAIPTRPDTNRNNDRKTKSLDFPNKNS